jgi:cell division protein ZapA (FtsZ GTPase activity inhibitor)
MAFGIKNTQNHPNQQNNDVKATPNEQIENNSGVDFLKPTKDAQKDSQNDPYRAELTAKSAFQHTMKTLNALKIVSPIISSLMQRPGLDAANEEMSASFRGLITETSILAENVCEKLSIDSTKERNFWIRNVLERNFAKILGDQWVSQGKIETDKVKNLIDDIVKFSTNVAEKEYFEEVSDLNLVKLAAINAMLPILSESANFDLYRNVGGDIEYIMTKLYNTASEATKKLADDYSDTTERAKMFYLLVQEAGELYAVSWKIEGHRINRIISSYPEDKLKSVIERYKTTGGFPIDKVDLEFDKYYDKMLVITEKLVMSQKGTIKNRLSNK